MKKTICLVLAAALLCALLAGCGVPDNSAPRSQAAETSSVSSAGLPPVSSQAAASASAPSRSGESAASGGAAAPQGGMVAPETYTTEPYPTAHTSDALNLRKGPGTNYEAITTLDYLTYVAEIGYTPSIPDWVYVRVMDSTRDYDGQEGWVAAEYLLFEKAHDGGGIAKPVIYLYPPKKMDVQVSVDFAEGHFTCTYPEYGGGWDVTAWPDGHLVNKADGREYSYLYWEGEGAADYDMSRGFVVKGSDTAAFLQEKLAYMGLAPKEYNEFIVYWLPQMQQNPYNLITFQGDAYTQNAQLTVTPEPDSLLRVFMVYRPLAKPIDIPQQRLQPFERKGFAVVEWGGERLGADAAL